MMFNRLNYYAKLTLLDLCRLWFPMVLQVAIVSGICLPILLLLGVNNGQIAQLTASLTKSSTGREINFSTVRNNLLRLSDVADLQSSIPNIDRLVPEGRCSVNLVKDGKSVENVAIRSTISGDPRLGDYGISINDYGTQEKPEIILSPTLAEELNVTEGDTIKLQVSRRENYNDIAETDVTVSHIFPEALLDDKDNKTASAVGYAAVEFVLDLRRYESGQQVERFGWAASNPPPEEKYSSFLIFTRKEDNVTKTDFEQRAKDIGMDIQEVADKNIQTLYGTLNEKAAEELQVFRVFYTGTEKDNYGEMKQERVMPLIDRVTAAVVPWNTPQKMKLNGKDECLVAGVTLPNIVWLKKYVERKEFFTEKDGVYQVILPFSTDASRITDAKTITVESGKDNITLTVKPVTKTEGLVPDSENTAFVPASLLAYFYASQNGNAVYETQKKIFIQKAVEPEITNFRCYAKTIYNVGKAIDYLRQEKHYGVQDGNRQQIDELSKRINELWLAVAVIGITVFLFGLITVFCVLLDSTDRKRGTIGILRVMGVSKFGVFYIIFLRSMSIGVISVFVTIALGFGLQLLLSYEWDLLFIRLPSVYLVFRWFDILILTAGELIVCFVGTLPPAYKASKLDPFAAVYN